MNSTVFEKWFQDTLLENLPLRKCTIVLDNASYHSRIQVKIPTKKHEMIEFTKAHNIPVLNPVPINAVLSQKIKEANIAKRYVIDEMAQACDHEVLRLPPYYCTLNPIELVWARLKHSVKKENVTPSSTISVCRVLRKCVDDISRDWWGKCMQHTVNIERTYSTCRKTLQ
ncbi:hypothetical protein C0J52_06847 [Blattella germanica]|nr:hypothetical protein C0J52_06847 [Blattella germanica]